MFVFAGVIAGLIISSSRAAECTVKRSDNGTDDSAFILKAFADCAQDSVITFSEANYSAYTPMSFMGLSAYHSNSSCPQCFIPDPSWQGNITIHLNGNLNLPNNISQVQQAISTTGNPPSVRARLYRNSPLTPYHHLDLRDAMVLFQWVRYTAYRIRERRMGKIQWLWTTVVGYRKPCIAKFLFDSTKVFLMRSFRHSDPN